MDANAEEKTEMNAEERIYEYIGQNIGKTLKEPRGFINWNILALNMAREIGQEG